MTKSGATAIFGNAVERREERQDHGLQALHVDHQQRKQHANHERNRQSGNGRRRGDAEVKKLALKVSANRLAITDGKGST
jgi:hypothetical protein